MRNAFLLALLVAAPMAANAQIVAAEKTYEEKLRSHTISALSGDMFGDQISLKDGSLHFTQVDATVPTNSGLKVEIVRRTPRHKQGSDAPQLPLGSGWELDIPYMMATFDTRYPWSTLARCSSNNKAPIQTVGPSPDYNTRVMPAHMYWSGMHISIPGAGYQNLLSLQAGHAVPQDGNTFIGASQGFWRVSCLSQIKNGTGEGFVVHLTDGTKYYFDWMAIRNAFDVIANDFHRDYKGEGTVPQTLLVPTSDVFLYATKVEDRHGNYVTYNFDQTHKHRLTSIVSSDGARIDVTYNGTGQIYQVNAAGSIWTYVYNQNTPNAEPRLAEVVRPDQSKWTFGGDYMWWYRNPAVLPSQFYTNSCAQDPTGYRSQDQVTPHVITFTHPSGAVGTFKVRSIIHGSDNTPGGCGLFGTSSSNFWFGAYDVPSAYLAKSIVEKRIGGPGTADQVWSYTYQPSWSFTKDCSAGCRSTTRVTDPAGDVTEYIFGNSYTDDIGLLIQERKLRGGVVQRVTTNLYAATSGPYPSHYGEIISGNQGSVSAYGNPVSNRIRPLVMQEIVQDGMTFRRTNSNFDAYARPTQIARTSSGASGGPAPGVPGVPTLTVPSSVPRSTSFTAAWTAQTGATSYVLERKNANQSSFSVSYSGAATSAAVSAGLPISSPIEFRVKACNSTGCSGYSSIRYVNVTGGGIEP